MSIMALSILGGLNGVWLMDGHPSIVQAGYPPNPKPSNSERQRKLDLLHRRVTSVANGKERTSAK
jgi:hypothetical protein